MIYMYGGPIGRDKITRDVVYIKSVIYVKNCDRPWICVAYTDYKIYSALWNGVGLDPFTEPSVKRLEYELVGTNEKGISKYRLIGGKGRK